MVTETTNQAGFKGGGAETINPQIKKDYFKQCKCVSEQAFTL